MFQSMMVLEVPKGFLLTPYDECCIHCKPELRRFQRSWIRISATTALQSAHSSKNREQRKMSPSCTSSTFSTTTETLPTSNPCNTNLLQIPSPPSGFDPSAFSQTRSPTNTRTRCPLVSPRSGDTLTWRRLCKMSPF